jgi:hypothetical protein
METHRKGEVTEAVALAELKRRGVPVSVPFGDSERYDLVAKASDSFYRLQVKTGLFDGETVEFRGYSVHTNSRGNVHDQYDGDVDYFLVYCHDLETMYLVDEDDVASNMRLRVAEPDVEQPSINWAEDYAFDERWPPETSDDPPESTRERVVESLRERGVDVFTAADSDAAYDVLLRSPAGELHRAIVRDGAVTDGRIRFATGETTLPDAAAVDYVVVHCEELDEQYLLERASFGRTMSLRVEDPEQRQPSINWAEEYEFDEQWPRPGASARN